MSEIDRRLSWQARIIKQIRHLCRTQSSMIGKCQEGPICLIPSYDSLRDSPPKTAVEHGMGGTRFLLFCHLERIEFRRAGGEGIAGADEETAAALCVEGGVSGEFRIAPVLAVGGGEDMDLLALLDKFEVERQGCFSEVLFAVIVLVAGLVAPTADEIAGGLDLDQKITATTLSQRFSDHQAGSAWGAVIPRVGIGATDVRGQAG